MKLQSGLSKTHHNLQTQEEFVVLQPGTATDRTIFPILWKPDLIKIPLMAFGQVSIVEPAWWSGWIVACWGGKAVFVPTTDVQAQSSLIISEKFGLKP